MAAAIASDLSELRSRIRSLQVRLEALPPTSPPDLGDLQGAAEWIAEAAQQAGLERVPIRYVVAEAGTPSRPAQAESLQTYYPPDVPQPERSATLLRRQVRQPQRLPKTEYQLQAVQPLQSRVLPDLADWLRWIDKQEENQASSSPLVARISRKEVCAVLGITRPSFRNKLCSTKKTDPAPCEENGSWAYAEIQPWVVRKYPDKAFRFPPEYKDFLEQTKLSTL